jgi:hypothetical protein
MKMTEPITINALLQVGGIIAAFWGGYKILMEIIKTIGAKYVKAKKQEELEPTLIKNIQDERDKIYANYDKQLVDIRSEIDDNHTDTGAKIQEVRAELEMLTECMYATLDGLHQLGCNGKVTEARSMLDQYLIRRAHD